MNILPNSSTSSTTTTQFVNNLITTTSSNLENRLSLIINGKCSVCDEQFLSQQQQQNHEQQQQIPYRMLAVRPSIGSKDPFFPILETLTQTSAITVPCCLQCSELLIEQWNEYELKNISIKNRLYNLPKIKMNKSSSFVGGGGGGSPARILAHPISLSTNNNNGNLTNVQQQRSIPKSNLQDEVLDLSMTGVNSSNTNNQSAVVETTTMSGTLNLTTTTTVSTASNKLLTGHRSRTSSLSSNGGNNSIVGDNIIQINPFSLNSSMNNLIKVSANSSTNNDNNNLPSLMMMTTTKKPLYCCTICDEQCQQLYSILIRPMGNCPYFPTLINDLKIHQTTAIDSNGKIGVCESCHHQLILQWDSYQKSNIPILERKYQLIRKQQQNLTNINHSITTTTTQPPISQSFVSLVAANKTFYCVMCCKDLIALNNLNNSSYSSSLSGSSINHHQSSLSNQAHIAFSLMTENDTSGNVIQKKLLVQSAQEINLTPFLSSSSSTLNTTSSTNSLKQLQLLHENDRVLLCYSCFSSINNSSTSTTTTPSSLNHNNNCNSSSSGIYSLEQPQQQQQHTSKATTNRSSTHHSLNDSLNGISTMTKTILIQPTASTISSSSSTTTTSTISSIMIPDGNELLLCFACKQHKSEYWVETKENSEKKPFYPFLNDSNELINGRARVCAQCHLILEIQWDGFENGYVPYNQRVYQLSSSAKRPPTSSLTHLSSVVATTTSTSTTTTTSLATSSLSSSSSPAIITQVVNGQPACPLKIQIAVPNSSSSLPSTIGIGSVQNHVQNNPSEHFLLTTVTNTASNQSILPTINCQDQHFNKLLNELLTSIGGPHPHLSGTCLICSQHSAAGQTFQIFSTTRNIILSSELGIYPYFPMLKSLIHNSSKKSKNLIDNNTHLACTYCYHSLMAQWIAYHLSGKPVDHDLSTRHYDCQNFVCYVCGVTTYRQFVRSITVKDFPFLSDHKRPPGSLKLNKGESVVTCLTCYQTLTHQWIENERMKVPLEMRKYNWMAVPPPPISTTMNNIKNEPINEQNHKRLTHSDRTIIPILTPTNSISYQLTNANSINHNGIISVPASNEIIPKTAIIVNTGSFGTNNNIVGQPIPNDTILQSKQSSTIVNVTPPTSFNPSHTLAPLVAAAMAATPVTIKQEMINEQSTSEPITTTNTNNNSNTVQSSSVTTTATTVLRHLARQQYVQIQYPQQIIQQPPDSRQNPSNSINLTTLASVAALAGNSNRNSITSSSQFVTGSSINSNNLTNHSNSQQSFDSHSHLHLNHHHHHQPHQQAELPKAVINSNSFALHFNALNNDNKCNNHQSKHHQMKSKIEPNEMENIQQQQQANRLDMKKNHENDNTQYILHCQQRIDRKQAQIKELEESIQQDLLNGENFNENLSKINLEVLQLRKKRLAHLNRLKEKIQQLEQQKQQSSENLVMTIDDNSLSDADLTEIDENRSISDDSIDVFNDEHESLVEFMDNVLPSLPLKENDDEDLGKMEFLSLLGLTTHRMKREDDLDNYIQTKMNRRLTHASFKVDWLNEQENDILEVDPEYETFKRWPYFSESKINPNSDRLHSTKSIRKNSRNKIQFFEILGLKQPSAINKLKTEIDWLAVIRNRQMRRKRKFVCVGKEYQNLDEQILRTWIPILLSSSSSDVNDSEMIQRIKTKVIPNLDDYFHYKDVTIQSNENENQRQEESQSDTQIMTIDCNPAEVIRPSSSSSSSITKTIITPSSSISKQSQPKKISNKNDRNTIVVINSDNHHQQQPITTTTASSQSIAQPLPTTTATTTINSKILNPKQFAQEFHESVLLETQKQMNGKQQIQTNGSFVNIINADSLHHRHHSQPLMLTTATTTTSNAQHAAIIYSDPHHHHHLRPVMNNTSDPQQQQLLIDRNGLISTITATPATVITSIKVPTLAAATTTTTASPADKLNIRDQIFKLQHRIDDINREYSGLNEKRNEIMMTMQRLEREKTLFQLEIDRLSKCLD